MNIKKRLISVGLSAALSAVPLIAQADFISNTAIEAGVDVLAKSSSKLPNQKLVLTEKIAGAVNDQFINNENKTIVLSLDNGAKFLSATVTWKAGAGTTSADISSPITPNPTVDDDGNLIIDGIQLNTAASAGVLTVRDIFIDTTKTEIGKVVKISLNTDLTTATGATFPALKIATVVDSDVEIKNASGIIPKFKSELEKEILDILISENASGAIATERTPKTIIVTLPTDWEFVNATNATNAPFSGHGTHIAYPAQAGVTGVTGTTGPNKAAIGGFFLDCKEGTTDADPCTFEVGSQNTASQLIVDVDGANDNPGKFTLGGGTTANLGNIKIKAPTNAATGDVFATVTVELFNGTTKTKQLKIAEVVEAGIKATVVDFTTQAFTLEPVADTTLPSYPRGFLDAVLDAIMVVENFGDDLTTDDQLKLTLPTGVVFSTDWLLAAQTGTDTVGGSTAADTINDPIKYCTDTAKITASESYCVNVQITNPSNPKGFSTVTLTIDKNVSTQGGLLIGGERSLVVNIGDNAALGDLVAVLSGTVSGQTLTPINLTLAKIVEGGTINKVVLVEGESVPTHGVGSSNRSIAKFTITEVVNGALIANNNTITLTLPEGITWAKAPNISETNLEIGDPVNFTAGSRTITLPVTTASTSTVGVITITGEDVIDISADYKLGDINVEIAGTAGATKSQLTIAKAANGTRLEVLEVTKLIAGKATQNIASIRVIENFKGALAPNGKFRLILPKGLSWAPAIPTVPTVLADGEKGNKLINVVDIQYSFSSLNDINEAAWAEEDSDGLYPEYYEKDGQVVASNTTGANKITADSWEFEISTTFNNKDTLVIQVPKNKSTGATIVPIKGLKVNVDAAVKDGTIKVTIDDGNTAGKDGAGVTEEDAVIGYIGDLPEFKVDPLSVKVGAGDKVTVTATGGLGTANISKAPDDKIATATALNGVITITGVAEGKTSIEISDGTSKKQTKTVEIEVTPAAELSVPATATVEVGKTTEVKITGGKADFTATSDDEAIATATLKDKTIIIKGVKEGTATITVEDGDKKTAKVTVTVKKAVVKADLPKAGGTDGTASGIDKDGKAVTSEAKFYGGVSDDSGATYAAKEIAEDKPITVNVKIEVDPAHKDKKGKYYVVAGYQAKDVETLWWFYKEDKSFVDWAPVDLATRVAYKETDALGTIEIEIAKDLTLKGFKGNYFVYLAYETTDDGSIYFNLPAIEFTIK